MTFNGFFVLWAVKGVGVLTRMMMTKPMRRKTSTIELMIDNQWI